MIKVADDLLSDDPQIPLLPTAAGGAEGKKVKKAKPLTLLPLIALIFFEVSGGPFGTEVSPAHNCLDAGVSCQARDSTHRRKDCEDTIPLPRVHAAKHIC